MSEMFVLEYFKIQAFDHLRWVDKNNNKITFT